jgi:hypothetical protein
LIAAGANIPRLGDQLHSGQDGVLVDRVQERGEAIDLVERAGERSASSNRHNLTPLACSENSEKFVPASVQDAPTGRCSPGSTSIGGAFVSVVMRVCPPF